MLASIPWRAGLPVLLGVRPATVLGFEAVFEACTAFHHSNWRLPFAVEHGVLVTTGRKITVSHKALFINAFCSYPTKCSVFEASIIRL